VNVIILGSPGSGKGTQAQIISKKFNLIQVSTGDLLRDEIKKNTEIGKKIEEIISKGDFASDDIVNKLLKNVVKSPEFRNRIIFDGYPRTVNQAENLELLLNENNQSINCILFLSVSREIIEKRILGRIVCGKCNKTMNEYIDKNEVNAHNCGKTYLVKRKDDNKEAITTRLDEYIKKTKPVLEFYSSRTYFHKIDGSEKIHVITSKIEQILNL
tara:strand:+ start:291 stop:932 length:642 start_codon:yes stop_codon:yes gene_type:complete